MYVGYFVFFSSILCRYNLQIANGPKQRTFIIHKGKKMVTRNNDLFARSSAPFAFTSNRVTYSKSPDK